MDPVWENYPHPASRADAEPPPTDRSWATTEPIGPTYWWQRESRRQRRFRETREYYARLVGPAGTVTEW